MSTDQNDNFFLDGIRCVLTHIVYWKSDKALLRMFQSVMNAIEEGNNRGHSQNLPSTDVNITCQHQFPLGTVHPKLTGGDKLDLCFIAQEGDLSAELGVLCEYIRTVFHQT